MGRDRRNWLFMTLCLVAGVVMMATTDLYAARGERPTAAAISDLKSVAGRWSGILYGRPGAQRGEDWIEFALHEDGSYTLASARTIGVFEGSGKVTLSDGRLIAGGEKGGGATLTLYQRQNRRFLRVEGRMASGQPIQADLYPAP